ncbi:hypothetical protein F3087_26940 [Nocardia colli]|uniref:Uncharacterized protein n=1 Tax=Nocardia colli TaxID=2545717 RepID=A0A5N0EB80_9NOCA|nr:hypothetical protein [Nocardia colli]KAA8886226.1 hypothetical protein F3087_26940 [Nocardia colli]
MDQPDRDHSPDLLDLLLATLTADIESQIRLGNPGFDRHRDERHTDGYREDMQYILDNRDYLLGATFHSK